MRGDTMCQKILLSDQTGLRVHYCQNHRTIELEIGAISVRLDEDALAMMSEALQVSIGRLHALHASSASFAAFMRQFNAPD